MFFICYVEGHRPYVTQWTYDSHNRLLQMIYPDEEKVTYSYNLGGQLEKARGEKSYGYDYVQKIGYDKFEQRTYLKYCNGADTFYTYAPARCRLQNLSVSADVSHPPRKDERRNHKGSRAVSADKRLRMIINLGGSYDF